MQKNLDKGHIFFIIVVVNVYKSQIPLVIINFFACFVCCSGLLSLLHF